MNENEFRSELKRAELMAKSDDKRQAYWMAYLKGLRRGFYGESFGTDEEHEAMLKLKEFPDDLSREKYSGYMDGIDFCLPGKE